MCAVCGDAEELSGASQLERPLREAPPSLLSGSAEDRSTAHLPTHSVPALQIQGQPDEWPVPTVIVRCTGLGAQPRETTQTPSWSQS